MSGSDLFPGFETQRFDTGEAEIFARIGGAGPPLLLLHGYPQSHAMWHRIAPTLAERFTCVIPDLRGYGASSVPASAVDHAPYSKRAMARDMACVMRQFGAGHFAVVGHDRGGRVAYRMALDRPDLVERLAVLDIVPTHEMWAAFSKPMGIKAYHWTLLAQPEPLPERLIAGDPEFYLDWTLASWTKDRSLDAFDGVALAQYRALFQDPARIHACCEDYRAGASYDDAADAADRKARRQIECPVLALWGAAGLPGDAETPLEVWRRWAGCVRGAAIECGHFLAEEDPAATLAALLPFLAGDT